MKKITSLIILLFFSTMLLGQEQEENTNNNQIETLFSDPVEHGGYGALMFKYSQINKSDAYIFGIRGGWTIGHSFTIGLAGNGFINNIYVDDVYGNTTFDLAGGYGGLLLEVAAFPRSPVHVTFPVIIGAGGIATLDKEYWSEWDYYWNTTMADAFFVVEPGVEVEVNIVKCFRLAFAVSYRYTDKINLPNTDSNVLNGFNYGMTFKFGKF